MLESRKDNSKIDHHNIRGLCCKDVSVRITQTLDSTKPIASMSLDLDNQWSYMKIHGDRGWQEYPSYLDIFVPHILSVLHERNLHITFFVVGKDAAFKKNWAALKAIAAAGHEIGNHSFLHESWMHRYPPEKLQQDILKAEECIADACGFKPIGFRGPGFCWSPTMIRILHKMGYQYDASTLPTYIGPLARRYYFITANLSQKEKDERRQLFGTLADGRRAIRPYRWGIGDNQYLQEIPVTTIPILKTPFHLSYLLFLSRYSMLLMKLYLGMAIAFCRLTHTNPSFLLHPLDLIGGDQLDTLSFFPGMDVSSEKKIIVFNTVLSMLTKHFQIINMASHARRLLDEPHPNVYAVKG